MVSVLRIKILKHIIGLSHLMHHLPCCLTSSEENKTLCCIVALISAISNCLFILSLIHRISTLKAMQKLEVLFQNVCPPVRGVVQLGLPLDSRTLVLDILAPFASTQTHSSSSHCVSSKLPSALQRCVYSERSLPWYAFSQGVAGFPESCGLQIDDGYK